MLGKKTVVLALLLVLVVVSAGCRPSATPAEDTPIGLPPDVAEAAKRELSDSVDLPMGQVDIVRANQVE
jgi:hypothetical protein